MVSSSLGTRSTFAQVATYSDNFQSVAIGAGVPGWVDQGVYAAWPDPLHADNVVYGFRQMRRRAVAGPSNAGARFGTFSTYTLQSFSARGGFEYRGRLLRTDRDARIGLIFFSGFPESDRHYILAVGPDAIQLSGSTDVAFSVQPNRWYDFLIQADDVDGATTIRARLWDDGTPEPQTFAIHAIDAAAGRLTSGRIGLWSAGGDVFVDDLSVRSAIDRTPLITFVDITNNRALDQAALALFKTPARIRIESSEEFTASLDGQPYSTGSLIDAEGRHSLTVHTPDGDATLRMVASGP